MTQGPGPTDGLAHALADAGAAVGAAESGVVRSYVTGAGVVGWFRAAWDDRLSVSVSVGSDPSGPTPSHHLSARRRGRGALAAPFTGAPDGLEWIDSGTEDDEAARRGTDALPWLLGVVGDVERRDDGSLVVEASLARAIAASGDDPAVEASTRGLDDLVRLRAWLPDGRLHRLVTVTQERGRRFARKPAPSVRLLEVVSVGGEPLPDPPDGGAADLGRYAEQVFADWPGDDPQEVGPPDPALLEV